MNEHDPWIFQAKSDLLAARRVLRKKDATTYCQVIAKCQQTVEKCVKGMAATYNALGLTEIRINPRHTLEHELRELDSIRRKRRGKERINLEILDRLISTNQADITRLSALAPKLPPSPPYPRNTEYPFHDAAGSWTAPANHAFVLAEAEHALRLAGAISLEAERFASALRRRK